MTDCITEYMTFCENTRLLARTVRCFLNKPWLTSDLKDLLVKKKMAFRAGDKEELKRAQRDLRVKLRKCKDSYRRKLEAMLQSSVDWYEGNHWITASSLERANEWNCFFNRFSSQPSQLLVLTRWPAFILTAHNTSHLSSSNPSTLVSDLLQLAVTVGMVRDQLRSLQLGTAAGPDGINPRILKTCASQLSPVLCHLLNLSLDQEKVPTL